VDFVVRARLGTFEPNADVFIDEPGGRIVVVLEIAGADPETLRVGLDGRYLIVAGRRSEPARARCGSFIQKEIVQGEFRKQIPVPVAIEYGEIAASYEDGLLLVVAPLAATAYMPTARTELQVIVKRTRS
jgi:HSP20 family protein